MLGTVLSVVMLAGLALLVGAFVLWRRGSQRKQVVLMVLAAAVCFANVAIWTVPTENGDAPFDRLERGAAD